MRRVLLFAAVAAALILAPTLAVFLIFQRRFVAALLQGSLTG